MSTLLPSDIATIEMIHRGYKEHFITRLASASPIERKVLESLDSDADALMNKLKELKRSLLFDSELTLTL